MDGVVYEQDEQQQQQQGQAPQRGILDHDDDALNPANDQGSYNARDQSSAQPGKLFIGGISWETTEDTLRAYFGKFGELTDAALMKDKYTGQPRGFGFVTFADGSGRN